MITLPFFTCINNSFNFCITTQTNHRHTDGIQNTIGHKIDYLRHPVNTTLEFAQNLVRLAAEMGREDMWHQRTPEEINQLQAQAAQIHQTFAKLRSMSYEQIVQQGVAIGSGFLIDMLTFKALCAGAGKVTGLSGKIKDLATAAKAEQSAATTTSITSGSNQLAEEVASTAKLIADHGPNGANKILNVVKENPGFVEAEGGLAGAAREVSNEINNGGTVWEFIKQTDPMYSNTRIPKSFELTVGKQKFWVHPNATDHMLEYITQARNISHGMPMNSQSLLHSFKASIEKTIEGGIQYTQKPFIIDCWELQFSPPRTEGLLPVIKHAIYKPKGF